MKKAVCRYENIIISTIYNMIQRNGRFAARVDAGDLVIKECEKVILHTGRVI